jgi:muramoyltetrapeptide carboxypeptidase
MIEMPILQKGDAIGITAPAKQIDKAQLQFAIAYLEERGFKVVTDQTIRKAKYLFSDTDEHRAQAFQEMIDNPDIKAIFSARGGYGSVRIIDEIDFSSLSKSPKWLVGFSDFTVFHCHLYRFTNLPTLHGTMPVFFEGNTSVALTTTIEILEGKSPKYEIESPFKELCIDGSARANIIGGNLSVLYSLCGSQSGLTSDSYILFLEDLCEYFYHTDRMMQNLKRNGIFENLAGVIIGQFTDMKDGALPFGKNAYEILFEYFEEVNIPVFTGFPSGHVNDNRPLIFGKEASMVIKNGKISLEF